MKKRKILSWLLAIVMTFSIFYSAPLTADAASSDFKLKDLGNNFVEIKGYTGDEKNLVIPYKIGKKYVAGIAKNAFANKDFTSVKIKDGVSYINKNAFYDCENLENISLPETIVLCGADAFYGTEYYYNDNNWEEDALYIGSILVEYRGEAAEYTIKEGTTVIGDGVFRENKTLTTCNLPDSLVTVGNYAFDKSAVTGDLSFSDNLMIIGDYAYRKAKISRVEMPDSVQILGASSFSESTVSYVKFPKNYATIPEKFFYNCDSLTTVNLPENLMYIGEKAFYSATITKLKLPKTIEYVEKEAFAYSMLKTIKFPDKYFYIGEKAFYSNPHYKNKKNCYNDAHYVGKHLVNVKKDNKTLEIKEGTKYIAPYVCDGHDSLQSVSFPESLVAVGERAFFDCQQLKKVTLFSKVKYIGEHAFGVMEWGDDLYRVSGFTIESHKNTLAHKYAKAYGFKFVSGGTTKTIKLNKSTYTMSVGETYILKKKVTPVLSGENSKWSSSNKSVVKVNQKGKITALKTGKATITVTTKNGKKAQCVVTVIKPPETLTIDFTEITTWQYDTVELTAVINEDSYISSSNIEWSVDNKKIAKLHHKTDKSIFVDLKQLGTVTVTAKTYNGLSATCTITVKPGIKSIEVDPEKMTIGVGEKVEITAITNEDAFVGDNLWWGSSQWVFARVKKIDTYKARITGARAGKLTINAHTPSKLAQCKLTVMEAPEKVILNETELTMNVGENSVLNYSFNEGAYANAQNIKWTSDNKDVVTVKKESDGSCTLTATGSGTATITVKTYNDKTATCTVTVN